MNNKKPRTYTGWSEDEANRFFEGIKAFGRDFQRISNHIKTKTYEQARHFYYRLLKKMNALLEPLNRQVNKTDKNEVRDAILFWYEFFKPNGKLTGAPLPGCDEANKLAAALVEFLEARPSMPSKFPPVSEPCSGRHKTLLPKTQSERINSVIQQFAQPRRPQLTRSAPLLLPTSVPFLPLGIPSPSMPALTMDAPPSPGYAASPSPAMVSTTPPAPSISTAPMPATSMAAAAAAAAAPEPPSQAVRSPPRRLTLQLIPKETPIADQIGQAGYNPLLQLTYASKKPISYIIQHMMKKWTRVVNGTEVPVATGPIRLYGVPPMDHHSWGLENDESSASIYQLLACDGVMRLLYSWPDEKENDGVLAAAATETATSANVLKEEPRPGSARIRLDTLVTPASPLLKKDELPILSLPAPMLSPIPPRPRSPGHSPTSPSRYFAATPSRKLTPGPTSTSPSQYLSPTGLGLTTGISPKFKVPDTPNIFSLSFFNEPSQDGFHAAENDEKECREFYREFDAASHDEDSGFAQFFRTARLDEESPASASSSASSPIRRRLDFSSFPALDSPAPGGKRRLSDTVASAGREDSEDGEGLFGLTSTLSPLPASKKRKAFMFGGSSVLSLPPMTPSPLPAATKPASQVSAALNISLDSLLDETNSNSCFSWMAETSNG